VFLHPDKPAHPKQKYLAAFLVSTVPPSVEDDMNDVAVIYKEGGPMTES
jgi:hypothetical protein